MKTRKIDMSLRINNLKKRKLYLDNSMHIMIIRMK